MKVKDQERWNEWVTKNQDPYGGQVIKYVERWADMMESEMSEGKQLEDIAGHLSHKADTTGLTGFMYGCAVNCLSQVWEHGEQLRKWHNRDTQIKDEGEKANEEGGVLNPALLTIG
jgi:hypothetical protein